MPGSSYHGKPRVYTRCFVRLATQWRCKTKHGSVAVVSWSASASTWWAFVVRIISLSGEAGSVFWTIASWVKGQERQRVRGRTGQVQGSGLPSAQRRRELLHPCGTPPGRPGGLSWHLLHAQLRQHPPLLCSHRKSRRCLPWMPRRNQLARLRPRPLSTLHATRCTPASRGKRVMALTDAPPQQQPKTPACRSSRTG